MTAPFPYRGVDVPRATADWRSIDTVASTAERAASSARKMRGPDPDLAIEQYRRDADRLRTALDELDERLALADVPAPHAVTRPPRATPGGPAQTA